MSNLAADIRAAIDEVEAVAKAASPEAPAGEHWQWECSHCDTPAVLDPVLDEHLQCRACEGFGFSLRSVEKYPTSSGYSLPTFVLGHGEEVPTLGAMLVVRHDSAAVLRRCAADRKILDLHDIDARPVLAFVEESKRKVATVLYEQVGLEYACPICDMWHGILEYGPTPGCATLLALAEAYGIEATADV